MVDETRWAHPLFQFFQKEGVQLRLAHLLGKRCTAHPQALINADNDEASLGVHKRSNGIGDLSHVLPDGIKSWKVKCHGLGVLDKLKSLHGHEVKRHMQGIVSNCMSLHHLTDQQVRRQKLCFLELFL